MFIDREFPDLVAGSIEIDVLGVENSGLAIECREITVKRVGEIDHLAGCLGQGRAGGDSAPPPWRQARRQPICGRNHGATALRI
jgi:hypothetical protein